MFRRLSGGLPKDPVFPADLKGLGYIINEKDEIRGVENKAAYFKYFITKNERHNDVQREAMNSAIRDVVRDRLLDLGLQTIRVPLGAKENEPNLPIFVSSNLKIKKRVIILFYEHTQDLGIFAHRIIGGKGGVNAGSAVDFVKYIQSQTSSPGNSDSPGIILANMGQLRWWRCGKKAVTQTSWYALPQKSAVENSYRFDKVKNVIPGNADTKQHVYYIFNHVVQELVDPAATLNVVGVSNGAVQVSMFLEDTANFSKWGPRISAFATVATWYNANGTKNEDFANWFLDRARAYLISEEPAGTFLSGPEGSEQVLACGCPVFSLAEPYYSEMMLPKGYKTVLNWFQEVAADPNYANPKFERIDVGGESDDEPSVNDDGDALEGADMEELEDANGNVQSGFVEAEEVGAINLE